MTSLSFDLANFIDLAQLPAVPKGLFTKKMAVSYDEESQEKTDWYFVQYIKHLLCQPTYKTHGLFRSVLTDGKKIHVYSPPKSLPFTMIKDENYKNILKPKMTVYVTFLPGSDFRDTLETVCRLKNEGYCPIPHFAARSIESEKIFEESLAKLRQEANVNEALLIGGGVDIPVGPFTASIEILRTGLFDKYGFNRIGVAGHPEGSPDITPKECEQAIREKNEFNQHTDADLYLATQFLFEAKPLFQWEKTIRDQGNKLPIHVGIPGLATIQTLVRHAKQCGVGPSVRFLKKNPVDMLKMSLRNTPFSSLVKAPSANPSKLIFDIVTGIASDKDINKANLVA